MPNWTHKQLLELNKLTNPYEGIEPKTTPSPTPASERWYKTMYKHL